VRANRERVPEFAFSRAREYAPTGTDLDNMKIIVDVFGGDYAPGEILAGCAAALKADENLRLILAGAEKPVGLGLVKAGADMKRCEVLDAPDVITNDDAPVEAVKRKTESSLVKALDRLKSDPEAAGLVSCGSTGAVLAGGLLRVGRIPGIPRPALAPVLPTLAGGGVMLIDCGANMDCKPAYLARFALMGSAYMRAVYGIEKPRAALLSVGTEDKKGNELSKAAFALLKTMRERGAVNFAGNMEARDCLSGEYDVIVADGYVGNVALKSMEGALNAVLKLLKQTLKSSLKTKIGGALIQKDLKRTLGRMDYTKAGGAPFLGVEKVIVKSHGSSKAETVCASILQAKREAERGVVGAIKAALKDMPPDNE
jgi:glycerol-3-phosphate acyltransferase PlsX